MSTTTNDDDDWKLDPWGVPVLGSSRALADRGPIIPPLPQDHDDQRSPKWPAFLKKLLLKTPLCLGCGRKAQTGHHEVPFHIDKTLELVESNVLVVCLPCHFVLCHGGDWRLWVKHSQVRLNVNRLVVAAAQAELAARGK